MKDAFPTVAELLERLDAGETSSIEAKASHENFSQDIWSTLSAFANASGGWIILGVAEAADGSFYRKGVLNAQQQVAHFFNQHNNRQKLSRAICQDHDVRIVEDEGLQFIIIRVPTAQRKQRPVYINGDPFRGTYRRQHDGDYRCSEGEIRIMMRVGAEQAADPDGYVFDNPGSSRVLDLSGSGAQRSDPRNSAILKAFRYVRWADKAGTGIKKIRRAWKGLGLAAPVIDSDATEYRFQLHLRHAHFLSDEERKWLEGLAGVQGDELQQVAMVEALKNDCVDNAVLCQRTGCHAADATKALVSLRGAVLLEKQGNGQGTWYWLGGGAELSYARLLKQGERLGVNSVGQTLKSEVLTTDLVPTIIESSPDIMGSQTAIIESQPGIIESSPAMIELTSLTSESPGRNTDPLGHNMDSPGQNMESPAQNIESLQQNSDALPGPHSTDLTDEIEKIGRKGTRDQMECLVLRICLSEARTADQLSKLLDRKVPYLQQNYLSQLVAKGKLGAMPRSKQDPKGRYVTSKP